MAGGHQSTVGKAGFLRDIVMPFDDDDFMPCLGEEICGTYTDDPATNYCNLLLRHLFNL